MAEKFKVLIADNLDAEGVEILENSGIIEVDYRKKTDREELLKIIGNYHGLIVRSATKVNKEVLDKCENLKVVIRAGVGVDNIDIPACSQKGVVVMNAPAGNSVSTAEQAIALMFALARKTPQANASMKEKKWEKSKFNGTQLTGKTIGVIGLGRIGKEVVKRCKGLQMHVLGFDPYIPKEALEYLQIELTDVDTILAKSDFITVHTPLTETTAGLVNSKNLSKLKPGVRLINCARGGIYDEAAIAEGIKSGVIAGAGLDVFTEEPPKPDLPLYELEDAILTPHLGASTDEAQLEVAKETADSMVEYLKSGVARNSLNFPTLDPGQMDVLAPWFELCEKLGSLIAQAMKGAIQTVQIEYRGELTNYNLNPLEIAMAKGLLTVAMGDEVNLVNAPVYAKDRGITIAGNSIKSTSNEASVLKVSASDGKENFQIRATVNFSGGTIIGVNNLPMEFKPSGHILLIKNKDVPKVVGELGTLLGSHGVNIASLQLARDTRGGAALTFIEIDDELPGEVLETLKAKEYILEARYIRIR
ncbi:MAG: phosphoglycerate dehydrogenase [Leptospiraceae bacterium]|nr:phosphoglycerate dehydrogenase [Leptospiraceae bacterium]